jgi:UDP-N-acetylglucosamine:LPS N-acetylglucosamine transferase
MTRPRIVFATIAAGGGHVAPARAMAEAVEAVAPGAFDVSVTDLMLDLGFGRLDAGHKDQWRWMLAHPWSARAGQRVIDAVPAATRWVLRHAFDGVARAAAARYRHDPPALIVANHGFLAFALTRSRRRYGLATPVLVQTTEPVDASALWAEPMADRYVVASRPVLDDLVRLGVHPSRIDVVGYPVRRSFLSAPTKAEARRTLGLEDRFTCLVTLGGEGVGGKPTEVVAALLALPRPPQLLVVTGRNAALAAALDAQSLEGVVVRGFVDDMATRLAACDVVIGKAGGATVMETLAVGRPLLVPAYAGLNEAKTLRFLEAKGIGHEVSSLEELTRTVDAYRAAPARLRAVAATCRALDLVGMSERLANYLVQAARGGLLAPLPHGRGLA